MNLFSHAVSEGQEFQSDLAGQFRLGVSLEVATGAVTSEGTSRMARSRGCWREAPVALHVAVQEDGLGQWSQPLWLQGPVLWRDG